MLKIKYHSQFKKDYKAALKSGHDKEDFIRIITQKPLPQKYKDHQLTRMPYKTRSITNI